MNSRRIRDLLLLVGAGILVTFTGACNSRLESGVGGGLVFPPTPTFPVVAAPIVLPVEAADTPSLSTATPTYVPQIAARSGLDLDGESITQVTATRAPEKPTTTAIGTATATATPIPSPTPCLTPGQIMTGQYSSAFAGTINYRAYLPPCYSDSGRTYPVLYMLPGNIYTDSIWDELGLDEAAELGINEKRFSPMMIVMVSGGSLANNTSGGPGSFETFMLEEFIPHIEGTYCALPHGEGRAIGGMSRGGYWALEIAFRHPDEFVSVGGHSAALLDFSGGPTVNPLDTGLNNDLGDLRIYLDIGENDWLIYNVQQLHEQMSSVDRDHTWVLNEGIHEKAYWATHVTDYLEWYSEPWLKVDGGYPPCRAISADYSP